MTCKCGEKVEDVPPGGEFVRFRKKWDQRTTIQHWQLRDLVSCSRRAEDTDSFYTVQDKQTFCYNTKSGKSTVVQKLDYAPASMTVGCGYIAAGGQQSQLDVAHLDNPARVLYQSSVGGSVNNALHIVPYTPGNAFAECRQQGAGDAAFLIASNNDDTIKVFALPSMEHIVNVPCAAAINYTAVSPSGQHMVCVGDSNVTYLYGLKGKCELLEELAEAHDSGMCCAWSPCGTFFAAASQDGTVNVWDLRNVWKPVAKFEARQRTLQGACRSIKFSGGPVDLLAFTEHTSYVHVVDTRAFHYKQTLKAAGPEDTPFGAPQVGEDHISGLAFCPYSARMYVGLESHVSEYAIDSAGRRSFSYSSLR
eukprot:jgi/Mesvir1/14890/Mv05495-RA.1